MPECSRIYAFAVILPVPILKPKRVQFKKQHRKVDARGLIIVHLIGACLS
jgi:hypothetical protein